MGGRDSVGRAVATKCRANMGKTFDEIGRKHAAFIASQQIFFTNSAGEGGRVMSPHAAPAHFGWRTPAS